MEQTMGKRISSSRKRMGLTQDALAEQLGVTAQAVSKWENDQSCPDITMLPKLAKIFGITTDELLGVEREKVYEAQVVEPDEEDKDAPSITVGDDSWKMTWNGGRKGALAMAVWVLLTGVLLLVANILGRGPALWGALWSSGLFVFGIFGLWPKFSFLRLGCTLFGAYFMLEPLELVRFSLNRELLLPVLLLLFGLSLLVDALRKKDKGGFHFENKGSKQKKTSYIVEEDRFNCSVSFGERDQLVVLPKLACGKAQSSFGEMMLDLTGCESFAEDCTLDVSCSFGEIEIRVPSNVLVEQKVATSFGSVDVEGTPDRDALQRICIRGSVSFGEVTVRYV